MALHSRQSFSFIGLVPDFSIARFSDDKDYDFETSTIDDNQEQVLYQSMMMVVDWEHNRTIYQFDDKVSEELAVKYIGPMLSDGVPANLAAYFPQPTIILYNQSTRAATLLSQTRVNGKPGLFGMKFADEKVVLMIIPYGAPVIQGDSPNFEEFAALRHILTVSRTKAIRKQQKDALSTGGDPATTDLVPVPPQQHLQYLPVEDKEPPLVRFSDAVADIPFTLFDLTSRTVNRNRKAERIVRSGWKMPPHVRRSHPHRYWVGHGQDKKLVTKWLAPMQIHAGQVAKTTVVHELRA